MPLLERFPERTEVDAVPEEAVDEDDGHSPIGLESIGAWVAPVWRPLLFLLLHGFLTSGEPLAVEFSIDRSELLESLALTQGVVEATLTVSVGRSFNTSGRPDR